MPYVQNLGDKRVLAYGPGAVVLCSERSHLFRALMAGGGEIVDGPEGKQNADVKPKSRRRKSSASEGSPESGDAGAGSGSLPAATSGD